VQANGRIDTRTTTITETMPQRNYPDLGGAAIDSILPDALGQTRANCFKRLRPRILQGSAGAARTCLMAHAPVDTALLGELCERK